MWTAPTNPVSVSAPSSPRILLCPVLCPHFNGHFQVDISRIRMSFWILLELKMMEVVVTTGAIRRAELRSNHHHQQTNTQSLKRPDALPVAQPTVSEHWNKTKYIALFFHRKCSVTVKCAKFRVRFRTPGPAGAWITVVKVRGGRGLSPPPAPIWAPCNSMSPLIESIKCYFMPK